MNAPKGPDDFSGCCRYLFLSLTNYLVRKKQSERDYGEFKCQKQCLGTAATALSSIVPHGIHTAATFVVTDDSRSPDFFNGF